MHVFILYIRTIPLGLNSTNIKWYSPQVFNMWLEWDFTFASSLVRDDSAVGLLFLIKWVVIDHWCLNAPGTTGPNQVLLNGICLWNVPGQVHQSLVHWCIGAFGALVHYLWNKSIFKQGGSQGIHLTTALGIYDAI